MQTARDDRAGKFLCHGLRRLVSGGGFDLIDVNAVESALSGEGARCDLRRDDRFFVGRSRSVITMLIPQRHNLMAAPIGFPMPSIPTTATTRCAHGGMTGSCAACALSGRPFDPSASTSTKSARRASVSIESRGARSLPSSAASPTQTTRERESAAETNASSASVSVSYCAGRRMCVVVVRMTLPFWESSSASTSMSVVFPPPPMIAVTPRPI